MTLTIITFASRLRESAARVGSVVRGTALTLALLGGVRGASAQSAPRLDLGGTISVGGEAEQYLRALQISGAVPLYAWTVQEFTPAEDRRLAPRGVHPWSARFAVDSVSHFAWLRPSVGATVNSAFPFQDAVGPTWMGRGVTGEVQAGVAAQFGRLRLQLAPVAFLSQNASFPLAPNGLTGVGQYADARFPWSIDHPQRFGDKAYGRVDLGTSTLALDLPGVALGLSNAPQRWGPARDYPLVLGPGAGGLPHAYLGTSKPLDLWLLTVHTRVIAGSLTQTAYSSASPDKSDRFASAFVVSVTPRGAPGLEIGATRFFDTNARASTDALLRVFSGIIPQHRSTTLNIADENQIVSSFFRWALPSGGFEVYGEWYREDYPGDLRRFIEKPDDLSDFTLGLQRVFRRSATSMRVFHAEFTNGELSPQERGQRGFGAPFPPYIHSEVVQGHTQRGLVLGSETTYGGAGWRIGLDDYTEGGRRTIAIERALRGDFLAGQSLTDVHPDVLYGVRFELMRFAGTRDYGITLVPAYDLNRNVQRGNDQFNLHASITVRGW